MRGGSREEPRGATICRPPLKDLGTAAARALGILIATALATGAAAQAVGSAKPPEPGYRAYRPPGAGPFPAVLFASGCSGFTPAEAPRHYERVAAEFTARGFVVVLVDYLGVRGLERCGSAVHPDDIAADILAAAAYVATRPFVQPSQISVIGWSMGGSGVLAALAALPGDQPPPFRFAVAYYPRCYGIQTPWKAKVPLLMLLAELDDLSSAWACQELVKRLDSAPPIEVRVYPNARHAFDVPELPALLHRSRGGTLGHDPQAAAAAREEVRRFLGLGGDP